MTLDDYIDYCKRIINEFDYSEETDDKYIFYDCYLNDLKDINYHHASKIEFIKSNTNKCIVNIFKDKTIDHSIVIES